MQKMLLAAAATIALAAPAAAAPVLWSGNGHYYEFIQGSSNWSAARAAALASSHLGHSGYLVTITSAAENAFLASLTGQLAWTGGNDLSTEGTWLWADGPEANSVFWQNGTSFGYTNWNGGEPNNLGDEDAFHFNWAASGGWNDFNVGNTHGYIVEYGGFRGAIPEPSVWALLILGFGVVGGALRRNRKVRAALAYA